MFKHPDANGILTELMEKGIVPSTAKPTAAMSGTTEGRLFTIAVDGEPRYVIKLDAPGQNGTVAHFLRTYQASSLLPKLLYADPAKAYIVYTYLRGSSDYRPGSKRIMLERLVGGIINSYVPLPHTVPWGAWIDEPVDSWQAYLGAEVEYAWGRVARILPEEDFRFVKSLVAKQEAADHVKYLLHGDCGVHNFLFQGDALTGVIDPSPITGLPRFDLIFAFCSSPDDLTLDTLLPAFQSMHSAFQAGTRLPEEVTIALFCRIGTCVTHHPHDLDAYLQAWAYWKQLLQ